MIIDIGPNLMSALSGIVIAIFVYTILFKCDR